MKRVQVLIAVSLLSTPVMANEQTPPAKAENTPVDCSKENWPNFSPSCIRDTGNNSGDIRLITAPRPIEIGTIANPSR